MVNDALLIKAGIDMEGLLKRLLGNESLVKLFIQKFTEDKTFEALKTAFLEKDMKAAEMASHTLKGMCGNLSLNALYSEFTKQVDLIRKGEYEKAEGMMPSLSLAYGEAILCMRAWLSEF